MRFKTDEHIPHSAVALLRGAGHDVVTVVEERLGGAADPAVLGASRREGRAVVTLDKSIADVRAYPPAEYAGIILLRPPDQGVDAVVGLLRRVVPLLAVEPLAGALWIVDQSHVRIRR